jgi:hypothetical protein
MTAKKKIKEISPEIVASDFMHDFTHKRPAPVVKNTAQILSKYV